MLVRVIIVLASVLAAGPSSAEQLNPDAAKRFVIGKLFAFNCFEGTRGAGRIYSDGSVAGSIQLRGAGPVRFVTLPAGTVREKSGAVCASVRGLPIEPCFDVNRTNTYSFRGSVSGLNFAYCDFTRTHPVSRATAQFRRPLSIHAAAVSVAESD